MIPNFLHDIKSCDEQLIRKKYNIIVNDDGTVYDQKQKLLFQSCIEWINYTLDRYSKSAKIIKDEKLECPLDA